MRKGLITFIPGALSLLVFLVVLIVLSVALAQVRPQVSMATKTTVDKDTYQEYTTLNALLVKDDGRFVELIREYGNADHDRSVEIENEIETMIEEDFSSARDILLRIDFDSGGKIEIGSGATATAQTAIATPDGSAVVELGISSIEEQGSESDQDGNREGGGNR